MPKEQITVATNVPLTMEEAWHVYTDPNEIMRWNFATDDWTCPAAETDLRVGGVHKARMEAKDQSFGFDFEGTYSEVDPPEALTLVLGDGRRSRTTFRSSGTETLVETVFDAEEENSAEMQRAGWQAILENYRRRAEQVAASAG